MEREEDNAFFNVATLYIVCSLLQIVGLLLVIFRVAPVVIGVCGFAGVVKIFLPLPKTKTILGYSAALAGLGLIIVYSIR